MVDGDGYADDSYLDTGYIGDAADRAAQLYVVMNVSREDRCELVFKDLRTEDVMLRDEFV